MHTVVRGPHYEHADEEVTTGDRQRRSGRAYKEASVIRGEGRLEADGSGPTATTGV